MAKPPNEDLESFLRRQDAGELVAVLLELAKDHEAVQARLARMQLADRPDKLAASFKKTLSAWKRSTKFYGYREAGDFGSLLDGWLDQVARELLPRDAPAALALFEAFIEADAKWFDRADDSDGVIGDAVRAACRHWLQAAARCETPPDVWPERLLKLYRADQYGARDELLRRADLLLDERAQRGLVARFESQLAQALETSPAGEGPPLEVFRLSGALSLLSESLRDPEIMVRASLRYSPNPNPVQRQAFARAYLDADRPADALAWLQDPWSHLDDSRQDLLADALERLGRFAESSPIRQRMFERTLSLYYFERWLEHLPEAARREALAHARELALRHDDLAAAATLLLQLGDPAAAETRLLAEPGRIDGNHYGSLVPLAQALRTDQCPRGETVVYRALLKGILDRAYARAYGHAARYWARLCEIAGSGVGLLPLPSHEEFAAEIRARHGRKTAFWAQVNGTRRDRHDDEERTR
ncbi:DUF6880 family protein [Accumulibacter sp.]|uniref:DUF6880 family protein n=1 Tax=Accumulibacter sp. TaxID=2053492 RepID=UPI0025FF0A7C|nr:DUF6880 family protein [Accumulibacter sp.]MCM8596131.1 hypothetical protein [Accumulibacter sp.]MCM8627919.1 hypothetical protein [Accumulibacter sp.]MDS4050280.1 hypothetical protein [Accumulibacter sp.]